MLSFIQVKAIAPNVRILFAELVTLKAITIANGGMYIHIRGQAQIMPLFYYKIVSM